MSKYFFSGLVILFLVLNVSCTSNQGGNLKPDIPDSGVFLVVLGNAQDGGYPQMGCNKECCLAYWDGDEDFHTVTSLALVDNRSKQFWLFDASPDIRIQLKDLQEYLPVSSYQPAGIFLTHAHIGHYSGLMQFGREVMSASGVPVWAMPRMDSFLQNNGPWSQLVKGDNIRVNKLMADSTINLGGGLNVSAFPVPHRDEYSETVGFRIESAGKKILFIPDIDKWEKWERNIIEEVKNCDQAFLDGTFYENGELPGRDMREIPHPFVSETMEKFSGMPDSIRSRIHFIHFNHTNPLIRKKSEAKEKVIDAGFGIAQEGMLIEL